MTMPRNYLLNGIADALKEAHEAFNEDGKAVHEALDRATREIANVLKTHNSNMDRQRFHSAAGYGTGLRGSCEACTVGHHDDCADGGLSRVPYTCDCAMTRHGDNA
jgi:hypothetical protein